MIGSIFLEELIMGKVLRSKYFLQKIITEIKEK